MTNTTTNTNNATINNNGGMRNMINLNTITAMDAINTMVAMEENNIITRGLMTTKEAIAKLTCAHRIEELVKLAESGVVTDELRTYALNELNAICGLFKAADKNLNVGTTTICANNYSAIAMMERDEVVVFLTRQALEQVVQQEYVIDLKKELGITAKLGEGTEEYVRLAEVSLDDHDYASISKEDEKTILKNIFLADISNAKNCRRLLLDLNICFRFYQELTIDAAKKLYKVEQTFFQNIVSANSTKHITHNFSNMNEIAKFKFFRSEEGCVEFGSATGTIKKVINEETGEIKKFYFTDNFANIQETVCNEAVEVFGTTIKEAYDNIKLSTSDMFSDMEVDMNVCLDLSVIAKPAYTKMAGSYARACAELNDRLERKDCSPYEYEKEIAEAKRIFEQQKVELSNFVRRSLKDIPMHLAGEAMFIASHIRVVNGKDVVIDDESQTKLFMAIAPELFLAYVAKKRAAYGNICGYQLEGNTNGLVDGQIIELHYGLVMTPGCNAMVESDYTGTLTVRDIDGVLYAVKEIEIERIIPEEDEITFIPVAMAQLVNVEKLIKTGYKNNLSYKAHFEMDDNNMFKQKRLFADANYSTTLHPYFNGEYNVVVMTSLVTGNTIPVATYRCFSETFEDIYAGLTFSNTVKNGVVTDCGYFINEFNEVIHHRLTVSALKEVISYKEVQTRNFAEAEKVMPTNALELAQKAQDQMRGVDSSAPTVIARIEDNKVVSPDSNSNGIDFDALNAMYNNNQAKQNDLLSFVANNCEDNEWEEFNQDYTDDFQSFDEEMFN